MYWRTLRRMEDEPRPFLCCEIRTRLPFKELCPATKWSSGEWRLQGIC